MKHTKHIPDDQLRMVALDRATPETQSHVENHISTCEQCQDRILELSVDSDWRGEIVRNCESLRHEVLDETSATFSMATPPKDTSPSGDEFDLQTVDRMLANFLEPPIHPEMLGRLGRYDIESVIGCGGMGVVLRGFDRDLYRAVAIKMILPRHSKNGTAKQRFAREARAAAVVLHPNVIPIYGIESTNEVPWIAMPLILGPTLKELVDEHGTLPEREIVRIGKQIASGLAAAHSQGLVHRDIKPENIMVDNQVNRVIITDFGLARRLTDEPMTQTGFLAGTINYMSPEQSRGAEIDARSDLFSLGGLLFFLATGQSPFHSPSPMGAIHAIGHEPHPRAQALNNEVSGVLSSVIDRLLKKDPNKRFQTAVEVETYLGDYLMHLQQPLHAPAPEFSVAEKVPAPKPLIASPRVLLSGVMLILIVGFCVWQGLALVQPTPSSQAKRPDSQPSFLKEDSNQENAFGEAGPAVAGKPSKNFSAFSEPVNNDDEAEAPTRNGASPSIAFSDLLDELENDVNVFDLMLSKPTQFWTNRIELRDPSNVEARSRE